MFLSKPMLGTQIDWSNPLNDGPVLDLLLNEGHGNIVNDLSGWGNNGTLHGFDFPPTRTSGWNPGMDGVALTFDGTDDYIDFGNNASLNPTKAIAIEVLMYQTANTGTYNFIVGKDEYTYDTKKGYNLFIKTSNDALTWRIGDGVNYHTVTVPYTTYRNRWVDIIATWNGTTQRLYLDYVEVGTPVNWSGIIKYTADKNCLIGSQSGSYFDGAIARSRILPRAMSAFEVMQRQINPYGVYQQ